MSTEDEIVAAFWSEAAPPDVVVPNGDDAGVFQPAPGHRVVVTTDAMVEGVHYERAWLSPEALGQKLLAVNLSDLAAMGATPRFVLVTAALPPDQTPWAARLAAGFRTAAARAGVYVLGGDTVRSPGPSMFSATAIGEAGDHLLVPGAIGPGDVVAVTGHLGDAALGLARLQGAHPDGPDAWTDRWRAPSPRIEAGRVLAGHPGVSRMRDVSDGVARDIRRLVDGADVGVEIDVASLPLSPATRSWVGADSSRREAAASAALYGGEDYELLWVGAGPALVELSKQMPDVPVTRIGRIVSAPGVWRVDGEARRPLGLGFDHFGEEDRA